MRWRPLRVVLSLVFCASTALAEDAQPDRMEPGWYVAADLAGGWNSWALYGKVEATYRHPLREKMDMVWSHGELGYRLAVSPAATRWGVHGEIMPAAFFDCGCTTTLFFFTDSTDHCARCPATMSLTMKQTLPAALPARASVTGYG